MSTTPIQLARVLRYICSSPLIRVHLGDVFAIDGYAVMLYHVATRDAGGLAMLGVSWVF